MLLFAIYCCQDDRCVIIYMNQPAHSCCDHQILRFIWDYPSDNEKSRVSYALCGNQINAPRFPSSALASLCTHKNYDLFPPDV